MNSLVVPDTFVIRLVDAKRETIRVPNVLFRIHTFARPKNDFDLVPFRTDANGVVNVTKREVLAEAEAHYDSGFMDYNRVEDCRPEVEIQAMTVEEVAQALEARTSVWKELLRGERERWNNIDELRDVYRTAANGRVSVPQSGRGGTERKRSSSTRLRRRFDD